MMNQAFQKHGELASAGRGRLRLALCSLVCLFVLAALLICAAPARAAEAGEKTASAAQIAPCKGLKPFNNLEELLYQFYINLNSDCIFKMSIEELEKTWNTKILAYNDTDKPWGEKYNVQLNSEYFRRKPYSGAELDAFYIEACIDADTLITEQFNLYITSEAGKAHTSLLPTDRYPKGLPEPIRSFAHRSPSLRYNPSSPELGKYWEIDSFHYFWLNTKKNRMILLGGSPGMIARVEVMNYILCFFTRTNDFVREGGAPCKSY